MTTNRWKPDTCACVIEYEFDETLADDVRTHSLKNIQKCQYHNDPDDAQAFIRANRENNDKNFAIGEVLKAYSQVKDDQIKWQYDLNRKLTITVPSSLKKADKDALNANIIGKIQTEVTYE